MSHDSASPSVRSRRPWPVLTQSPITTDEPGTTHDPPQLNGVSALRPARSIPAAVVIGFKIEALGEGLSAARFWNGWFGSVEIRCQSWSAKPRMNPFGLKRGQLAIA